MGAEYSKLNATYVSGIAFLVGLALLRLKSGTSQQAARALLILRQLLIGAIESIRKNPIMESMVATGIISYLVYSVQDFFKRMFSEIKSMFYCSITVQNTDENYAAIVDYVSRFCARDKSSLVATTKKEKWTIKKWRNRRNGIREKKAPELDLRPTRNLVTSFHYKGHRIFFYRRKGQTITTGWERRPLTMESITLTCFGRDNGILKQLLQEAMVAKLESSSGEISIFVLSSGWLGGWELALQKNPRTKKTVVLDANIADELLHDARTFLKSQKWYSDRGIPYRRGYLLYGPPGCGKTSFTQVIAGELKQDMCMLSLSDKNLDDSRLAANLREAPLNSIILLEDVDAVFVERTSVQKDNNGRVTFSGLLNAIDGVASQEGRMLFMTTNHIEKLDPALVRPGRCDVRVELKKASSMQMREIFLRFFPEDYKMADEFARKLPKFELSMAQLQGHLLEHRSNARLAVERVPKLLQSTKPQATDRMSVYDHLRRVGLEMLSAYFEYHGYHYKDELKSMSSSTVLTWVPELKYEPLTVQKLDHLLKGDEDMTKKQYALAELSTIREAFIAAFPVEYTVVHGEAPPKLRRTASHERHGLLKNESGSDSSPDHERKRSGKVVGKEIEALSKKLCERLSRNGKGVVSVYQLHYLFSMFHDPREVVENAHVLTRPRKDDTKEIKPMTSFEFLKRAGMVQATPVFEKNGVKLAREIFKLKQADLGRYNAPGLNKGLLMTLIKNDKSDANITAGMRTLGRRSVVNKFLMVFPGHLKQAWEFARTVTDDMGRGLVSGIQLKSFLKKYEKDISKASENARKELVDVKVEKLKPPSQPPLSDVWVTRWLKTIGLQKLSPNFLGQGLKHYDDIVAEPILKDEDLKSFGINKIGERRLILRKITKLLGGEGDGLTFVYRASKKTTCYFTAASIIVGLVEKEEEKDKKAN
ncbi:hypothetical protein AAMO2058_000554700 [Amorphochlora amoebiformis]